MRHNEHTATESQYLQSQYTMSIQPDFNIIFSPSSSGKLMEPPTMSQRTSTKFTKVEKKTIRGRGYDSDSDSEDD